MRSHGIASLATTLALVVVVVGCTGTTSSSHHLASPSLDSIIETSAVPAFLPSATPSLGPAASLLGGAPIMWQTADGLATARPDGSERRVLFPGGRPPDARHADWSPDGASIVFATDDNETSGSFEIWIAGKDGSAARRLVDCLAPCIYLDSPAWSPDGRTVALVRRSETPDDLWSELVTVDAASGDVRSTVRAGKGRDLATPRWAPDSHRLVVEIEEHLAPDGSLVGDPLGSVLAVVDLADARPSFRAITDASMFAMYPDWHPTEETILFIASGALDRSFDHQGRPADLYTIHPDGTGLTRLTNRPPATPWLATPAWTSTGQWVLLTLISSPTDYQLGVVSRDGTSDWSLPGLGGAHGRQARN
jgi:hypothetical protein